MTGCGSGGVQVATRESLGVARGWQGMLLTLAGLTRDRYDRALAHVVKTDALGPDLRLNREIVARGGARVRVYPDTSIANAPLLAAEREARAANIGLWGTGAYRIPQATHLPQAFERFQLVEGVVAQRLSTKE